MVILCVIPAMSDFGNAEVVKLARKYDPQGIRTLGVVTKCDDAANAEASDIVEKAQFLLVLMLRDSDVRLELGFHCVVNRSQKNIDDGMSREDLWNKEKAIFTKKDRMKTLPEKNWGTLNLMERVAKIQEARVDECLPKIKDAVRKKTGELQEELRKLPAQADTEADQFRLFNGILARIRNDLVRRIRAEFMSAETSDRELTIAPIVASMVQSFRKELPERNPDWLGQDMIDEVDDTVQTFVTGYTVENLVGPHVFINLIKQTFIEEGLLKDSVNGLVGDVGEHLRKVVAHVIGLHANINGILANSLDAKAEECIDQLTTKAREVCEMLSEAQQVTSTTHGQYMVKLTQFRKSWFQEAADGVKKFAQALLGGQGQNGEEESELPEEFVRLVEQAQEEPQKLATLEICASLHVYTGFMIEGFVEMSAKLVKFTMVEQLADKLEETWRDQLAGTNLHELFPRDETIVYRQEDLKAKIHILRDFKEQMVGLKTAALPVQKGKQTVAEKARARADAKAEQAKAQVPASSSSAADAAAKKPPAFTWNFAKEVEGKTFRKGDAIKSEKFTLMGVPDLHLSICPQGDSTASEGHMSVYLYAPEGWQIRYKATVQDVERLSSLHTFSSVKSPAWGFADFKSGSTEVALELLEAIPPESKA